LLLKYEEDIDDDGKKNDGSEAEQEEGCRSKQMLIKIMLGSSRHRVVDDDRNNK